jgi:uncharacterized protein
MDLDEDAIARSLDDLRKRSLVRAVQRTDSRVTRYQHLAAEKLNLDAAELAVMCVLMLRGPQTAGEIRTRTGRMYDFTDLAQLEQVLTLLGLRPFPLAVKLPRRPGQKDSRYAHLLSGEVTVDDSGPDPAPARTDRLETLEQAVDSLRTEVAQLRAELEAFRKEFQ